jgi:glycosyltransferase involved in cell wall biosynthesis
MLGIRSDARIALFVGRLEPGKGAELLVPSCSRTDYELAVAGRTAPDAGIYLGKLSPEKMAVAYAAADCVLFPTRYEGCSYVVLEALASGVPLITTDVGWMSTFLEHVPTYRSLVVRPEVSDVSRMLHALATSNTDEIVASAREYVIANNSYECFSRAWLALVEEVMNSSN